MNNEVRKPLVSSSEGQIYITDLRSKESLAIQFLPDELNINRNVNLSSIGVVARNNPVVHWLGGSKELSFTFYLVADDDSRMDAIMRAKWLESLTYQDTTTGQSPKVAFIWGRRYKNCKWIVSKLSFKEKIFVPAENFLPLYIEVSITLTLANDTNELVSDIRDDIAW